ncbi:MAG: L-serine ammonia-lyase, iron-sulfur-dependent, subunit alpha [Eubacteriales bacterium]|nr:L-serine ammonia-lyase, iron-sulfur-dependent, subunit alpha [Eubacteriales bacterium]
MEFHTLQSFIDFEHSTGQSVYRMILEWDMQERMLTEDSSFESMKNMYLAMKYADDHYDGSLRSRSGAAGGDGDKLSSYFATHRSLTGDYISKVMETAVKMGESNACMKRIVAAPTAGACGVIPAILISYEHFKNAPLERLVEALFISGGVGTVIAENASISGAEGGCQAEIGSASAMGAAALAYLEGGNAEVIVHAAALALKGMLGSTCDPVAGLVEVPCIKRNVLGAVNAVSASQMALAGIRSVIPPDEVIESMRRIGNLLPTCLRETSQEGLAATPTGNEIRKIVISGSEEE